MPFGVGVIEVFAVCRRHTKLSFKKRPYPPSRKRVFSTPILSGGDTFLAFKETYEVALVGKTAKPGYFKHRVVGGTQELAGAVDAVLIEI